LGLDGSAGLPGLVIVVLQVISFNLVIN